MKGSAASPWWRAKGTPGARYLSRIALGVAMVLGTALAVASSASQATSTGSISGTVTAATGGGALSGICVAAYATANSTSPLASATTQGDGTYAVTGLPAGTYNLEFSVGCGNSGNYLTQWYNNETSFIVANAVTVSAGSTTSAINAALATGGTITGTVTAASGGASLSGICVDINQIGGSGAGTATTAANGTYSISGLSTGSYDVEFFTGCGNSGNYLTQWYENQPTSGSAISVPVSAGATTASINAALVTGATITGTVTAAVGGSVQAGICVDANQVGGSGFEAATTKADGTYTIAGLATGSYDIEFSPNCGNSGSFLTQWYHNEISATTANAVAVTAGSTTSGINAALAPPGTITGTVTAAMGGAPVSGICVNVTQVGGLGSGFAITASDGSYSISGLETGSYSVEFSTGCGGSGNFLNQWYNNEATAGSANLVSVTAGSTTAAINAALAPSGTIVGTVTDTNGGAPLSGICVDAFTLANSSTPVSSATTQPDGTYAITGLETGSYDIEFSTGCGNSGDYLTTWYNTQTSVDSANAVTVTVGLTTSSIDASLTLEGSISGTVTAANGGAPIGGICVNAYVRGAALSLVGSAITADDGTYQITGLDTGSYDLEFSPGCGSTGNYWPGVVRQRDIGKFGYFVGVTIGENTSSINAALADSGEISGTVTAATGGADLSGICVKLLHPGTSRWPRHRRRVALGAPTP